ncbi:AarF/UbiB family protein [Streptomyces sp. B1866]|uniref:ABC1 kinase family protein n=1 Tax=Streptomyces sp. B1866 TaxID=3075431 RepID=UPI002891EC2D|nr:AarF/UbiB family protein [Streptomyces sp. B1866]MDT3396007.1 AarF/UbiB family protein [Streptomyces sp. B1866]
MSVARARLLAQVARQLVAEEAAQTVRSARAGDPGGASAQQRRAVSVREAFERLGPLYVKVGQILSTRPDIVPPAVAHELESLHDRAVVLPFAAMEPVLREALGHGWRGAFRTFDVQRPLGAASLAQVYAATLADGTPVAVKVQRPGIRPVVEDDMRMLRRAARFFARRAPRFSATIDVDAMLGVVFDAMRPELDFTVEARNTERGRAAARRFEHLDVPRVVDATEKVMIQSLAPGTVIRDADRDAFKDEQRAAIGRDLLSFMFQGYFTDLTFHADPHPGNVFVAPGQPATLIDWGMVGRVDRRLSMSLVLSLLSVAQNDGTALARSWVEMGRATPWADVGAFIQDMTALVPQVATASLEELDFGATLTRALTRATRRGIQTSPMVSILGKSFANLEGSVRCLAPELRVIEVFQDNLRDILLGYARDALSEVQLARTGLELLLGALHLPGQARDLARDLANHELAVQVGDVSKGDLSPLHQRADARWKKTLRAAAALAAVHWWTQGRHHRRP